MNFRLQWGKPDTLSLLDPAIAPAENGGAEHKPCVRTTGHPAPLVALATTGSELPPLPASEPV